MMRSQRLITRSYVLGENDCGYMIEYYLCSQMQGGNIVYGITINEHSSEDMESRTELFEQSESAVVEIIHLFAGNFVFACSLSDLIYEYRRHGSF